MARFGADHHRRERDRERERQETRAQERAERRHDGVDPDRPTRNDVERAARSDAVETLADLARILGVSKARARTLALETDVTTHLREFGPAEGDETDDGGDGA